MLSALASWATTISLIFGGCCSNAVTLEQLTLQHPNAGSILTFFQFLLISIHGLPKFIVWKRFGPWLRKPRVPIMQYLLQVALFYLISLLNNAAFAYHIPMAVHIIFRSGGLIISMTLGWLVSGKVYSTTQIISVLLVTAGVILTTLSASNPSTTVLDLHEYGTGIGILTVALVLSGFLGLLQDRTYSKYVRVAADSTLTDPNRPAAWQESMFYLHFFALPMFYPLLPDIASQMHALNTRGPRTDFRFPLPLFLSETFKNVISQDILPPHSLPHLPLHFFPSNGTNSLVSITQPTSHAAHGQQIAPLQVDIAIPQIYLPLILNTITGLICVAGVHRLTTRVNALTVTLVLVVRKAVSLVISVVGVGKVAWEFRHLAARALNEINLPLGGVLDDRFWRKADQLQSYLHLDWDAAFRSVGVAFVGPDIEKTGREFDERMMWTGAAMVLLGTIGYTIGSQSKEMPKKKSKQE